MLLSLGIATSIFSIILHFLACVQLVSHKQLVSGSIWTEGFRTLSSIFLQHRSEVEKSEKEKISGEHKNVLLMPEVRKEYLVCFKLLGKQYYLNSHLLQPRYAGCNKKDIWSCNILNLKADGLQQPKTPLGVTPVSKEQKTRATIWKKKTIGKKHGCILIYANGSGWC